MVGLFHLATCILGLSLLPPVAEFLVNGLRLINPLCVLNFLKNLFTYLLIGGCFHLLHLLVLEFNPASAHQMLFTELQSMLIYILAAVITLQ